MPQLQVLNPGQSRTINAPVREVEVYSGDVVVTPPAYAGGKPVAVATGAIYEAKDTASLNLHSPTGSRFTVTLSDEPVQPKPKRSRKKKAA